MMQMTRRARLRRAGRSRLARIEQLELRTMLTGTGFPGNDCPPDLDLSGVPLQTLTAGEAFTLDLGAMNVVTDVDLNGDPTGDVIRFVLDPDVPDQTPLGAEITSEGVFSWTPNATQLGMFDIVVIAIDAGDPALADAEIMRVEVVEPVNEPPVLDLNGPDDEGDGFNATFEEEAGVVQIVDLDLSITDADNDRLTSATATITNLLDGDNEFLTVDVTGTNLTAAYDPMTGTLTLTGDDTLQNYENVLRTLQYANVSDDPNTTTRAIDVMVSDGEDPSNVATATVDIIAFNDAPDIAPIADGVAFVGAEFETTVTVTDPDSENVTLFLDDDSPTNATLTQVDATTWLIRWTPDAMDGDGPFTFRVNATDDGTPVAADSESFMVTLGNPLAQADLNGDAEGVDFAVSYTEGDGAVAIFSDELTVTDPTDTELQGATVTITNLADGADESLSFDVTGTAITGAYDSLTGVLTLTGADTLENYETVLRSIRYTHSSEDPTAGDRIIEVSLDDGTDFGPVSTSTVTVNAENDSPDLILPGDFGDPGTPVVVTLGGDVSFTATVNDVDDELANMTFMLDLDNSGIGDGEAMPTIDAAGMFQWTPTATGTFEVTVIVTDGSGGADQETFLVQVDPVNEMLVAGTPATTEADGAEAEVVFRTPQAPLASTTALPAAGGAEQEPSEALPIAPLSIRAGGELTQATLGTAEAADSDREDRSLFESSVDQLFATWAG
ncbi:MAG: putative Ig domain-containing protein [Planctomycetota bacterium]